MTIAIAIAIAILLSIASLIVASVALAGTYTLASHTNYPRHESADNARRADRS